MNVLKYISKGIFTSLNEDGENYIPANVIVDKDGIENLGSTNDTIATSDTGSFSIISLLKRLLSKIPSSISGMLPIVSQSIWVDVGFDATVGDNLLTGNGTWFDASNFNSFTFQLIGNSTANLSVIIEQTSDQNVASLTVRQNTPASSTIVTSTISINNNFSQIYEGVVSAKFIRARIVTSVSGSVKLIAKFSNIQYSSPIVTAAIGSSTGNTVQSQATAASNSNGLTNYTFISASSTNATNIKNSSGKIFGSVTNLSASTKYLKLYNKASSPTIGTDVPVQNIAIPPNTVVDIAHNYGIYLSSGISFAITNGQSLLDNTAVSSGDVILNIRYA